MSYRRIIATALTATCLAVPALAGGIVVTDPYARAAGPSAKAGAAFMTIRNDTGTDDRLIAARTDAAKRVELHTHVDKGNGVMQMTEIEGGIPVSAGGEHHLMRGGDHVMLMGLIGPLDQGAEINLVLVFEIAGDVSITIPVDNERKPETGMHSN